MYGVSMDDEAFVRIFEAGEVPPDGFHHADLLAWQPSILDRYYRAETLDSDRARRTFVMPDRLILGAS